MTGWSHPRHDEASNDAWVRGGAARIPSTAMTTRGFLRLVRMHAAAFFTNWREYDGPFGEKVALTVRNRLHATFSKAQCCGHPGQPGC